MGMIVSTSVHARAIPPTPALTMRPRRWLVIDRRGLSKASTATRCSGMCSGALGVRRLEWCGGVSGGSFPVRAMLPQSMSVRSVRWARRRWASPDDHLVPHRGPVWVLVLGRGPDRGGEV